MPERLCDCWGAGVRVVEFAKFQCSDISIESAILHAKGGRERRRTNRHSIDRPTLEDQPLRGRTRTRIEWRPITARSLEVGLRTSWVISKGIEGVVVRVCSSSPG